MKKQKTTTIKPEIRKQIEKDILACEYAIEFELDNLDLFTTLSARYTLLDRNFLADLPSYTNYYEKIVYSIFKSDDINWIHCFVYNI